MGNHSSVIQMTSFGFKRSHKVIVVMSPDFMNELWCGSEPQILSEHDVMRRRSDMIVVDRFSCDLPRMLAELTYIDARGSDWWVRLLKEITYQGKFVNHGLIFSTSLSHFLVFQYRRHQQQQQQPRQQHGTHNSLKGLCCIAEAKSQ